MKRGFTLIELIVVIVIVGILAAVGISQYSATVEKSRLAEAKVRIGTMRQLAYQYYMENGTLANMQNPDIGVDFTCTSTNFYRYTKTTDLPTLVVLAAYRCLSGSGGKTPNASRQYEFYQVFYPSTGQSDWHCTYTDDLSSCFGLPP